MGLGKNLRSYSRPPLPTPSLAILPPHPIPSITCKLYLQYGFRIQPFLTMSIVITLVCATITCHWDSWNSFLTAFPASMLAPEILIPIQQSGDLLKHRLEHISSLCKPPMVSISFSPYNNLATHYLTDLICHLPLVLALLQTNWLLLVFLGTWQTCSCLCKPL